MPRPPRILHPGAWYHVTARGIERRPIFKDTRDRAHFRDLLAELVERYAVRLHAFVMMDNHYHLLLELTRPNLSRAIQWLNVSHSVWFNRRHRRSGYLFQGRFKSIVVDPRDWALRLTSYIHLNPVRVARLGLGKTDRQRARTGAATLPDPSQLRRRINLLRSFRWSSYRAYTGLDKPPAWLDCQTVLQQAGGPASQRHKNYRRYVENQVRTGLFSTPWEELQDRIILGAEKFAREIKKRLTANDSAGKHRWASDTVPLEQVIKAVETARKAPWKTFAEKHGDYGRDCVLYLARRATGLTVAELAATFGLKRGENVSMAVKRYQTRIHNDPAERKTAAKAAEMLFVMTPTPMMWHQLQ